MKLPRPDQPDSDRSGSPGFVEMPNGLFTASGNWFHVRRSDLEAYAGAVVEKVGLRRLIRDAETVVHSPHTLATWILIISLIFSSPTQAILAALVAFTGWSVLGPGLVLLPMVRIFWLFEHVWLQAIGYVGLLSLLASYEAYIGVWVGLAGFILLRWGVIEWVVRPLVRPLAARLYRLPLPDQSLRAVILRYGLRLKAPVQQLDEMESTMISIATRHKRPK